MNRDRQTASASASDESLIDALDRAAELERGIVAEALRTEPSVEELQRVEAARQRAERAPRNVPRTRIALGAAALLVAVFVAWRFVARDEPRELPRGVTLGGSGLEVLAPDGPVDAFTLLRWRTTTRGAPRFAVRVVDAATGAVLLDVRGLRAPELALDNRDTSAWHRIRVEVDELDAAGEPVKSGRALAWRRSP